MICLPPCCYRQHDPAVRVQPTPRDRHHAAGRRLELLHPAAVHARGRSWPPFIGARARDRRRCGPRPSSSCRAGWPQTMRFIPFVIGADVLTIAPWCCRRSAWLHRGADLVPDAAPLPQGLSLAVPVRLATCGTNGDVWSTSRACLRRYRSPRSPAHAPGPPSRLTLAAVVTALVAPLVARPAPRRRRPADQKQQRRHARSTRAAGRPRGHLGRPRRRLPQAAAATESQLPAARPSSTRRRPAGGGPGPRRRGRPRSSTVAQAQRGQGERRARRRPGIRPPRPPTCSASIARQAYQGGGMGELDRGPAGAEPRRLRPAGGAVRHRDALQGNALAQLAVERAADPRPSRPGWSPSRKQVAVLKATGRGRGWPRTTPGAAGRGRQGHGSRRSSPTRAPEVHGHRARRRPPSASGSTRCESQARKLAPSSPPSRRARLRRRTARRRRHADRRLPVLPGQRRPDLLAVRPRFHPILHYWRLHAGHGLRRRLRHAGARGRAGHVVSAGWAAATATRSSIDHGVRQRRRPGHDLQPPDPDRRARRARRPRPADRLLRHDRQLDRLPPALRDLRSTARRSTRAAGSDRGSPGRPRAGNWLGRAASTGRCPR